MNDFEGHLYEIGVERTCAAMLQDDFDTLRPQQRSLIKDVATQAHEYGQSISFDRLKSHRRYLIGRGLIDLIMSDNFDEDLIRSICYSATGYEMKTAGGAVCHLNATQAEVFRDICKLVRFDEQEITYDTDMNIFRFPNKQKVG